MCQSMLFVHDIAFERKASCTVVSIVCWIRQLRGQGGYSWGHAWDQVGQGLS